MPESDGGKPAFPAIDGIDVDGGCARALSDGDFYAELLGIFLEDHGRSAEAFKTSLAEGRRRDALRVAHSVKGEAANIGAEELRQRAGACEAILREGRDAELPAALDYFEPALARVARGIKAFLDAGGYKKRRA